MYKYLLLIPLLLFIFALSTNHQVWAAECDKVNEFTASPTSGDTSTSFRFAGQINNCPNRTGSSIVIRFLPIEGTTDGPFTYAINTDGSGNFDFTKPLRAGKWHLEIVSLERNRVLLDTSYNITVTKVPVKCYDRVPPNSNDCPPECKSVDVGGGEWYCGGKSAPPSPGSSGGTAGGVSCDPSRPRGRDGSIIPGNGVMTAIGCVPTEPSVLIQYLIKFAVGIGGGIALLLMVAGAFQMITSSGNPEGIKKGQEQFVSAIIGLLFIIFSVLLLQIIGVKILDIPGFK